MILNLATRDCKFCYFSVVRVGFALYVFDLYIDVFDGNHGCKGNMLDAGKNCPRSIEGNFMMNTFLGIVRILSHHEGGREPGGGEGGGSGKYLCFIIENEGGRGDMMI